MAYAMIDENYAYLSPSSVYRILKKHDLIVGWKRMPWSPSKPMRANHPDEKWQTDIMYVKVKERFFYLVIFIDEYSRYITHHALLTSMDSNSVSLEAQKAIEILRRDSLALPEIQSVLVPVIFVPLDSGEGKQDNPGINFRQSDNGLRRCSEGDLKGRKMYNFERRHSSLQYLTPAQYYRGNPGKLLNIRKAKLERARQLRKEKNMIERGGEAAKAIN